MTDESTSEESRRWGPLGRIERRVAGVLVEKAKTTPDNYPLTLNSLVNGCNQKSNRSPQLQLDEEQVYDALDELRKVGAVSVVQGDGRAEKYRHLMYEWLGVDKVELAVMAELLLRGQQTLGELRGRAARMEPIKGISELQPVVDSLRQKGMLQYLTPPGRGCIVSHALYQEREQEKLLAEVGGGFQSAPSPAPPAAAPSPAPPASSPPTVDNTELHELRDEIATLKQQIADVQEQLTEVNQLRTTVEDLTRQLGV